MSVKSLYLYTIFSVEISVKLFIFLSVCIIIVLLLGWHRL